eukprot:357171-Chlamydomonas_euryale.AAC.2
MQQPWVTLTSWEWPSNPFVCKARRFRTRMFWAMLVPPSPKDHGLIRNKDIGMPSLPERDPSGSAWLVSCGNLRAPLMCIEVLCDSSSLYAKDASYAATLLLQYAVLASWQCVMRMIRPRNTNNIDVVNSRLQVNWDFVLALVRVRTVSTMATGKASTLCPVRQTLSRVFEAVATILPGECARRGRAPRRANQSQIKIS